MGKTAAIAGAGTMGAGIAQVAATAGWEVRLYDAMEGSARKGLIRIREGLEKLVDKGRLQPGAKEDILDRIDVAQSIRDAVQGIDLFIEAAVEDLAVKRSIFAEATQSAPPDAILASNTSSLSITAIAAATRHPEKVAGMHFFNPAPVMRLVEIVKGDATSDGTIEALAEIAKEWGKAPAVARDTPGFIVNRIARPFYGEALRLLGEGCADVATIDRIMTSAGGFRMGPFQLIDLVGVDVNLAVTKSVFDAYFQDPRFRPHPIQQKMVDAGWLGRKSGRGFYRHDEQG